MEIHLGYEVGAGQPVSIPANHTLTVGITQSGKTETFKALAKRAVEQDYTVLVVDVKRQPSGIRDFQNFGKDIPIFLKERTDPLVMKGLIESKDHIRIYFQFSELIRACEGVNTMEQVFNNIVVQIFNDRLFGIFRKI